MKYLLLFVIVIFLSIFYSIYKSQSTKVVRRLMLFAICFALCGFAGLRTGYNDTPAYISEFYHTPQKLSAIFNGDFSIENVYLFRLWNFVVYNYISKNVHIYFFLSSVICVCPLVFIIDKYSKNFVLSMILFMMLDVYLFSLAGLKQAMAIGILALGINSYINKDTWKYVLSVIIAMGFHSFSFICLIIPILGRELWSKKTIVFCLILIVAGLFLSNFRGAILAIVDYMGETVDEDKMFLGSINPIRLLVYLIPVMLTIAGAKNRKASTGGENILAKISVLSGMFMTLALFGSPILFGRIPQYFLLGTVISLPDQIECAFGKKNRTIIIMLAAIAYCIFGIYELYNDGAFATDIFKLIWF